MACNLKQGNQGKPHCWAGRRMRVLPRGYLKANITDRGRGYCVSVCWAIITKYSWPEELVNYGNLCSLFWRLEVWDLGISMVPCRRLSVISKGRRAGHPSGVSFIRELIPSTRDLRSWHDHLSKAYILNFKIPSPKFAYLFEACCFTTNSLSVNPDQNHYD